MGLHRIHQVRVKLQERRNRIREVKWQMFFDELRFFCKFVQSTPPLSYVVQELEAAKLTPSREQWLLDSRSLTATRYDSEDERAAFFWYFLNQATQNPPKAQQIAHTMRLGGNIPEETAGLWHYFVDPFWRYLDDHLENSTEALDLLERYVRRVEMFTGDALYQKYTVDSRRSEEILTEDLKLYLFDGGIDYPISPSSSSGIVDIASQLEKEDALLLEVKIVDPTRNYDKDRVLDGMRQIARYTREYNKPVGYLVIFVVGNVRVLFSDCKNGSWPPFIDHEGRKYFLVTVQLWGETPSASKGVAAKEISVSNSDLQAAIAKPS